MIFKKFSALRAFFVLLGLLTLRPANAQLLPAINSSTLPADSDSIAAFTPYIDTTQQYTTTGFQIGDLLPEFYFADTGGTMYSLSGMLADNKPVLLITGNYTCPIFRDNIQTYLPQLINDFGSQINIYIIYELEMHPQSPWISPISGTVWMATENIQAGIYFPQPWTYSDRKFLARFTQTQLGINVPILIDSPDNAWWLNYGPSADNCYLVRPDGHVAFRQGWFANTYTDLYNAISQTVTAVPSQTANPDDVRVFPVPATNDVQLRVNGFSDYTVELRDCSGRMVYSTSEQHDEKVLLRRDQLSAGVYFCRVQDAQHEAIVRVIFQ